jgi:hypothetical protein
MHRVGVDDLVVLRRERIGAGPHQVARLAVSSRTSET